MRKIKLVFLSVVILFSSAYADLPQERMVLTSVGILKDIFKEPKTGISKELLHNAKAIAVFPNLTKSAFFFGGSYGDGILSVKNEEGKWSNPIFVHLKGLSAGIQFGYQSSDTIIVFKTDRSLDGLTQGKIKLGLAADAVAFAKGVGGGTNTDEKLAAHIRDFKKSSGVFIGVSLDGATIYISDNENFDYYGKLVYIEDIINNDIIKTNSSSKKLLKTLNSF